MIRAALASTVTVGVLAGSALAAAAPAPAQVTVSSAPAAEAAPINAGKSPCRQQPDLTGRKPGQLLAKREVPVDPTMLTGARMFRVLYTTTGVDESKVQATCGLVILPTGKKKNQVVAWAHGTVGVHQSCQPSNDPSTFLNLGPITYGTGPDAVHGSPRDGILQGLVDQGRMITATDYYSGLGQSADHQQNYIAGVPAGAAVLDSVRTGIKLAKQVAGTDRSSWRLAIWGASQGGHSAMWAGQLARAYFRKTPLRNQPDIKQVGVVATVPASSFVATSTSPKSLVGRHLADLEMHRPLQYIGGLGVGAAGPILFSQVMTSWAKYAAAGDPPRNALFPGYPRGVRPQLDKVLTDTSAGGGATTAQSAVQFCVNEQGLVPLAQLTQRFLTDPAANAFFVQPVWGEPDQQGVWQGRLDRTCLNDSTAKGLQKWCRWLAYNMPGPEGVNPFNKIPRKADGSYAPVLIGQGMNDTLIYCQNPGTSVPAPGDCMARQLYDSLHTNKICRSTRIQLDLFAFTPQSPASHLSTTHQLADNGHAAYAGSPMDTFLKNAFAGNVRSGCSARVVNK